jgi:hypothetical protein
MQVEDGGGRKDRRMRGKTEGLHGEPSRFSNRPAEEEDETGPGRSIDDSWSEAVLDSVISFLFLIS